LPRLEFKINTSPRLESLNEFVSKGPYPSIFQTGYMVEVYRRAKRCEPIVLAAENSSGEIIGSLVGIKFTEKEGLLKNLSSHSTIRGGPIFLHDESGQEVARSLLLEYETIVKRGTLYSRIYPQHEIPQFPKITETCGFAYEGWLNFFINLERPQSEIWRDMSKYRRRGIVRAEKIGLKVEEVEDRSQLEIFYHLLRSTHERARVPLQDISLFESVFDYLVPKNLAKLYLVTSQEQPIACRLALTYRGTLYDWYAGRKEDSGEKHPDEFLVWQILKWGSKKGFHTFDFGGAGVPNEDYGPREFKRRFGGRPVNLGRYTKVHNPKKLWISKKAFSLYSRIGRKLVRD